MWITTSVTSSYPPSVASGGGGFSIVTVFIKKIEFPPLPRLRRMLNLAIARVARELNWHMLIGEFTHTLDIKRRVSLPAKFRKEIGRGAVITRGLDKCLFIYPKNEWDVFVERLGPLLMGQKDNRDLARMFLSGASDVETDKLGRILIPEHLKRYADLKNKVVITGMYKRLEVWDQSRWEEYRDAVEKQTDVLAEKLGEMGVY